ncbi:MAG: acyl-CoA thioesterase [Bacteroidales bacterium]|nr:acyl-CoA thioesterase [Bacteroidales bacterium]
MITDEIQIRPRYGEVDRMGYVYHANYVHYCHQARTELLRKYGINDCILEKNNIMLPVVGMNLKYFKPAYYDELLTVKTSIREMPHVRFKFEFEITNKKEEKVCTANTTLVFVEATSRVPTIVPELIEEALKNPPKSLNS